VGCRSDNVRDRLGLACPRRSLHDEIAAGAHLFDHAGLRGIRGNHVQKVDGFQPRVEPFLWAEEGRGPLEPAVEQPGQDRVRLKGVLGPMLRF
jgi:hypothetical protein